MSAEEWKPIPGCPGYQASNQGRIRSLQRSGEPKKVLSTKNDVNMTFGKLRVTAHPARLVIWAFQNPVPEEKLFWRLGYVNGDYSDRRPENLYLMEGPEKRGRPPIPRRN